MRTGQRNFQKLMISVQICQCLEKSGFYGRMCSGNLSAGRQWKLGLHCTPEGTLKCSSIEMSLNCQLLQTFLRTLQL